jgi:hypothetical protein
MDELKKAIEAAGAELRANGWLLDAGDELPVLDTQFGQVMMKHIAPVFSPEHAERARQAKVAALRAELAVLEQASYWR